MYRDFNLILDKTDRQEFMNVTDGEIENYDSELVNQKKLLKSKMKNTLETNIDKVGNIDGSKLTNDWFPNIKADIFISHSHDDLKIVKRLAIWLEKKFQMTTFIDSAVWGSATELLKEIDNEYSVLNKNKDGTNTYNYRIRNYTTAHVHMMLSTALMEMINSTECLLFLNTPKSIHLRDFEERKTKSPWIYNELKIASMIEKKEPKRLSEPSYKAELRSDKTLKYFSELQIDHDVTRELSMFNNLTNTDLIDWQETYNAMRNIREIHALDILYSNSSLKDN